MNIKTILTNADLKVTRGRLAILEILFTTKEPITIESINGKIKSFSKGINRSTVFRFINLLYKKGLVKKLEFAEGKFRYELSSIPHHYHVICTQCGTVQDVEGCDIESLEEKTAQKLSFHITSHRVDFFGLCPKCQ